MSSSAPSLSFSSLSDLPQDVSPTVRWGLFAAVVLVHVVVATLVVITSKQAAVVGEITPISVTLLTQTASGQIEPAVTQVPRAPELVHPQQKANPASPAQPNTPPVAAVAAPVQAKDMVVPIASVTDSKVVAEASPVAEATPAAQTTPTAPPNEVVPGGAPAKPVQLSHTSVRYLKEVRPVFPKMSERLGEYGTVMIAVLVDEHGFPVSATVSRSSGYTRLDAAARDAAMQSRYVPYTLNGVAKAFEVTAPFTFKPPSE